MSASLVGSEMCIRDRPDGAAPGGAVAALARDLPGSLARERDVEPRGRYGDRARELREGVLVGGVLEPDEVEGKPELGDRLDEHLGGRIAQGLAVGGRVKEEVREVHAQSAIVGQAREVLAQERLRLPDRQEVREALRKERRRGRRRRSRPRQPVPPRPGPSEAH
eukprot:13189834-Alexandrium_andersonii.AAC.1